MEITVEEVVRYHLQKQNQTVDQLLAGIVSNLEMLARQELASELRQKCVYGCFADQCECNFCGDCIDEFYKNLQEKVESQMHDSVMSSMYQEYRNNCSRP